MNLNKLYLDYSGGGDQYKLAFGHTCTEGTKALCNDFKCFWMLDVILSYQPELLNESFQTWKLERTEGDAFKVTATDGNENVIAEQVIPFSDFEADEVTLWNVNRVIMLPNEY